MNPLIFLRVKTKILLTSFISKIITAVKLLVRYNIIKKVPVYRNQDDESYVMYELLLSCNYELLQIKLHQLNITCLEIVINYVL